MPASAPDLSGQVAIVTGGSSGIGAGISDAFGRSGARVVVNYHGHPDGAEATARAIRDAGGEAITVRADVAREEDVLALFSEAESAFGPPDILVANAGLQKDGPAETLSLDDWRKVLDVNLTGQFLCCREAIKAFLRRDVRPDGKARGKIVCISSVHERIPWAGHVNYAASKGGVMLMMQTLAQEFAGRRIRINAVAPGAIRTPINRDAWDTEEALAKLLKLIPYGRIGEVEDIANAALWLASDLSDYVTGATLFVDGGMALYPEFREGG